MKFFNDILRMPTQNCHYSILLSIRRRSNQFLQCLYKIVHSFSYISNFLRNKKYDFLIQWKICSHTGSHLVTTAKDVSINCIRDVNHLLSHEKGTLFGLALQPTAACYEMNVPVF